MDWLREGRKATPRPRRFGVIHLAWLGKAGAFGYQDRTGWLQIIEGSESNVVGLPLELLHRMLPGFGDDQFTIEYVDTGGTTVSVDVTHTDPYNFETDGGIRL